MQDIHLENIGRGPVTLVLPHDLVCSEERCLCARQRVVTFDHNPQTGDRAQRPRLQRMPLAVQLFGGHRSGALPRSALRAPDVAKALRARAIRVSDIKAPAELAPAESSSETPQEGSSPLNEPTPELAPEAAPEAAAADPAVSDPADEASADQTTRRTRNRS